MRSVHHAWDLQGLRDEACPANFSALEVQQLHPRERADFPDSPGAGRRPWAELVLYELAHELKRFVSLSLGGIYNGAPGCASRWRG
jgi:hypothetical protein